MKEDLNSSELKKKRSNFILFYIREFESIKSLFRGDETFTYIIHTLRAEDLANFNRYQLENLNNNVLLVINMHTHYSDKIQIMM